jgi:hypothetical protein
MESEKKPRTQVGPVWPQPGLGVRVEERNKTSDASCSIVGGNPVCVFVCNTHTCVCVIHTHTCDCVCIYMIHFQTYSPQRLCIVPVLGTDFSELLFRITNE